MVFIAFCASNSSVLLQVLSRRVCRMVHCVTFICQVSSSKDTMGNSSSETVFWGWWLSGDKLMKNVGLHEKQLFRKFWYATGKLQIVRSMPSVLVLIHPPYRFPRVQLIWSPFTKKMALLCSCTFCKFIIS